MSDVDTGSTESTESTETNETMQGNGDGAETGLDGSESQPDTFPATVVRDLRKENADHRVKAKAAEERAEQLAQRLHTALVTASGRLENPDDLAYDADHLDDPDKLDAAITALLTVRPYLKARKVIGDAGQGPRGGTTGPASFADLFRG